MNYLRSIGFKRTDGLPDDFPFTLPAIESLDEITFSAPVTFLVGENGSGKSTVLQAIAVGMQCPAIGRQDAEFDELLLPAKHLAKHLTFTKSKKPKRRMFFRAEDAMGFTLRVRDNMADLKDMEDHFDQTLTGEGRLSGFRAQTHDNGQRDGAKRLCQELALWHRRIWRVLRREFWL